MNARMYIRLREMVVLFVLRLYLPCAQTCSKWLGSVARTAASNLRLFSKRCLVLLSFSGARDSRRRKPGEADGARATLAPWMNFKFKLQLVADCGMYSSPQATFDLLLRAAFR